VLSSSKEKYEKHKHRKETVHMKILEELLYNKEIQRILV
jgi:hypothetical protein